MTTKHDISFNLPELEAPNILGKKIAQALLPGSCIYLNGELGAGKTTLVRAILQQLGVTGRIKSPTYTIVEVYEFPQFQVYHFDLYRVTDPHELQNLGIREYSQSKSICLFEWAEKGLGVIPAADLEINLHYTGTQRELVLSARSDLGREILDKI